MHRCRHQRRHLRQSARLLHDHWRRQRDRGAPRSDLLRTCHRFSELTCTPAASGATNGWSAAICVPGRTFRQDGPQWHRIWLMQAYAEGFEILKHANSLELPAELGFELDPRLPRFGDAAA